MNFIEEIVEKDLQEGVNDGRIQTRFPPEPTLPPRLATVPHSVTFCSVTVASPLVALTSDKSPACIP